MPYASDAQRRFFHTATARKKGISAATVHEFDTASKGMKLPERTEERREAKSPQHMAMAGLARAVKMGHGGR